MVAKRGEIYLVDLDPTTGSEIRKVRPVLVVSPNEMNQYLRTVIIAPMTTGGRLYPSRVPCQFQGKEGTIALDQIRTVDLSRLSKRLGIMEEFTVKRALAVLVEMFAPDDENKKKKPVT